MTQLTTTQRVNEYIQWLMSGTCYLGSNIEDTAFGLSNKTLMKYLEMTTEYKEAKAECTELCTEVNFARVVRVATSSNSSCVEGANLVLLGILKSLASQLRSKKLGLNQWSAKVHEQVIFHNEQLLPKAERMDKLVFLIIPAMEDKLFTKRGLAIPTL